MEEILEQMVHFICAYRHWNIAKVSKLPPNVIESEYAKAKYDLRLKQLQEKMVSKKTKNTDDGFYEEPEIVNRRDLEDMYPDGVPEGIIIDDFLGPTNPDNGKGRR